jgi:hypothetical protein
MNKKTQKSNIPLLTMNGEVVITVTQFEESFKEYEKEYEKEIKNRSPLFMEKWLENKKERRLRFFKNLFFAELQERWLFKKNKKDEDNNFCESFCDHFWHNLAYCRKELEEYYYSGSYDFRRETFDSYEFEILTETEMNDVLFSMLDDWEYFPTLMKETLEKICKEHKAVINYDYLFSPVSSKT